MIKRLPLILFILTLASCGFMILIRISGSGLKLLSAKTGTGRFIAANYNSCIIVFIVILAAFICVTFVFSRRRRKRKEAQGAAHVPSVDEAAFEAPFQAEQFAAAAHPAESAAGPAEGTGADDRYGTDGFRNGGDGPG